MARTKKVESKGVHAARSVFYGSINDACMPEEESKAKERRERIKRNRLGKVLMYLTSLSHGARVGKDGQVTDVKLNAAQTVQQVLLMCGVVRALNDDGTSGDAEKLVDGLEKVEGVKPLAQRFNWRQARASILGWAKETGADLNTVSRIFQLDDAGDKVVASAAAVVASDVGKKNERKARRAA